MGEGIRHFKFRRGYVVFSSLFFSVFCFFVFSFSCIAGSNINVELGKELPLLKYFPVWTAGILEVKKLDRQLDVLGVLFSLLDESSGKLSTRPRQTNLSRQFDRLIRKNLGMSGNKFLRDIIGKHFVLGWGGLAKPNQFGLICEVKDYSAIANLLTLAKASPVAACKAATQSSQPSRYGISRYILKSKNIRAAVVGRHLLILATIAKKNEPSMFDAIVDIVRGELTKTFISRTDISLLANKLNSDYDFLFLLSGARADVDEKKSHHSKRSLLSRLLNSVKYFAVVAYEHQREKNIELRVFTKLSKYDKAFWLTESINFSAQLESMAQMPADFVYLSAVNPLRWYHRILELAEMGHSDAKQYRQMIELLIPNEQLREEFFDALGPEMLILVGSYGKAALASQPTTLPTSSSELPDITIAIKTSNPTITTDAVQQMFRFFADFVSIRNIARDIPTEHVTKKHVYNGFVIHTLDMSNALGDSPSSFVHQLCWCLTDEYLIVSTRLEAIYELIDRTFEPEKFPVTQLRLSADEPISWLMRFNPSSLANRIDVLVSRLNQFRQGFNVDFSMRHQSRIVLGIGAKVEKDAKSGEPILVIAAVLPGYPAWGKIKIGDVIVAINGEAIGNVVSVSVLSTKIAKALKRSRTVKITVLRGKVLKDIVISVPKTVFAGSNSQAIMLFRKMLYNAGENIQAVVVEGFEGKRGEIEVSIKATKK